MVEVYTLEQLRKMNQLDGDKKLLFAKQVKEKIIQRVNPKVEPWGSLLEELGLCRCIGDKEKCNRCV